ncbi:hypothetical protein VULLAG_LOCUS638 [Vulpes lagopus]
MRIASGRRCRLARTGLRAGRCRGPQPPRRLLLPRCIVGARSVVHLPFDLRRGLVGRKRSAGFIVGSVCGGARQPNVPPALGAWGAGGGGGTPRRAGGRVGVCARGSRAGAAEGPPAPRLSTSKAPRAPRLAAALSAARPLLRAGRCPGLSAGAGVEDEAAAAAADA